VKKGARVEGDSECRGLETKKAWDSEASKTCRRSHDRWNFITGYLYGKCRKYGKGVKSLATVKGHVKPKGKRGQRSKKKRYINAEYLRVVAKKCTGES